MKASNPGNVKTAMVYIIDPLGTSNDLLMTPNDLKWNLQNYSSMEIEWKLVTQAI